MRLIVDDRMSRVPAMPTTEALLIATRIAVARTRGHRPHLRGVLRRGFGPLPRTATGKLRRDSLHGQAKAVE